MAKFNNVFLGCPQGRVGNYIYKFRNGKPYISAVPVKYTVSNSEKSVKNKTKFKMFAKLCTAMNKDFLIKSLWKAAPLPGDCNQNKQMQMNYKLTEDGINIDNIKLFPSPSCCQAVVIRSTLNGNLLELSLALSTGASIISEVVFNDISVHGLLKLSDNSILNPKPIVFLPLASTSIPFIKNVPLEFKIPLLGEELIAFNSYPQRYFTLAVVIKNTKSTVMFFSDNVNGEWTV